MFSPILFTSSPSSCFYYHNSIGAAALCLSWFTLVLSMRKFPKLGIYVVMFTEMFRTFTQFFVVLLLFIIAFGLGFHVLLYDQVKHKIINEDTLDSISAWNLIVFFLYSNLKIGRNFHFNLLTFMASPSIHLDLRHHLYHPISIISSISIFRLHIFISIPSFSP